MPLDTNQKITMTKLPVSLESFFTENEESMFRNKLIENGWEYNSPGFFHKPGYTLMESMGGWTLNKTDNGASKYLSTDELERTFENEVEFKSQTPVEAMQNIIDICKEQNEMLGYECPARAQIISNLMDAITKQTIEDSVKVIRDIFRKDKEDRIQSELDFWIK